MPNYDPRIQPSRDPQISGSTTTLIRFDDRQLSLILACVEGLASRLGPTNLDCLFQDVRALAAVIQFNQQETTRMSAELTAALADLASEVHHSAEVQNRAISGIQDLVAKLADAASNNDVPAVTSLTAELTKTTDALSAAMDALVAVTPTPAPAPEPTPEPAPEPVAEPPAADPEAPAPAADPAAPTA